MTSLPIIAKEYAPYDTFPEFLEGFESYGKPWVCPYDGPGHAGYKAQAWDRGLECASRTRRWVDLNVGSN